MTTVKLILQYWESCEQLPGRRTLQNLYSIGHGQRRRDGYEQMDMVRLDIQGQYRPFALDADLVNPRSRVVFGATRDLRGITLIDAPA